MQNTESHIRSVASAHFTATTRQHPAFPHANVLSGEAQWRTPSRIVLHAEDDEDDHYFFARAFKGILPHHQCVHVTNGEGVCHYLQGTHGCHPPQMPEAIVTDLKMPGMGGVALLKWLRAHPEFHSIPILVYSASTFPGEVQECLRLAAGGYYEKSGEQGPAPVLHALRQITSRHAHDHRAFA